MGVCDVKELHTRAGAYCPYRQKDEGGVAGPPPWLTRISPQDHSQRGKSCASVRLTM
jgi:hypothetical protein